MSTPIKAPRLAMLTISFSLSLPPMEKEYRKIVHDIANFFNLKSKSDGHGNSRHPTLHKTARSVYDANDLDLIESKLRRKRFLPHSEQRHQNNPRTPNPSRWAAGRPALYRDGEVVGAAAPELGAENRGRAMLERMGWSSGTALGAVNNKGILQPVAHVVKVSRAGLG